MTPTRGTQGVKVPLVLGAAFLVTACAVDPRAPATSPLSQHAARVYWM
jgi:hypothetical protein